ALQPVCGVALTSAQRRTQEGSVSGLVEPQGNGSAPKEYLCPGGSYWDGSLRRAIATFGPPTTHDWLTPTTQHSEEPGRKNDPEDPPTKEPQREPVPPGWDSGGLCFGCGSQEEFEQRLKDNDRMSWHLPIMFVEKKPRTSDGWSVVDGPSFKYKPSSKWMKHAIAQATKFWSKTPPGPFEHWVGPLKIENTNTHDSRVKYVMIYRYPLKQIQGAEKAPSSAKALKWIIDHQMPDVKKMTVSHELVDSHYQTALLTDSVPEYQ
ncbi:unnamed protein product, partial [Amoebophrya sp. A120]